MSVMKTTLVALVAIIGGLAIWQLIGKRMEHANGNQASSTVAAAAEGQEDPASNLPGLAPRKSTSVRADASAALAHALINNGASVRAAIDQAVGPSRVVNSPELAAMLGTAQSACTDFSDNKASYLSKGQMEDPTRRWATERLAAACHGLDSAEYKIVARTTGIYTVLNERGKGPAVQASLEALRSEASPTELYTAGQVLLENDRARMAAVLPNGGRNYGDHEIVRAWALATTMVACDQYGGCGPNSVETAALCANAGCTPGSNFSQAVQDRLPQSEYQAVTAFYSWVTSLRQS
ncbi:hypothetical protein [Pseudoxanthomonas sp. Root630]|uniref:hypothetical protein n=1 Tax=Pseudoxanthomonas sp. Root630 TaxID=1736574 RepID=UPI0007031229|nr:hypothetical protein [Pseudoxanthomonas sp. Root630]KRA44584.1 hypothetical protein ASD72_11430 [Pseudoxanthomonas sp. Root630]